MGSSFTKHQIDDYLGKKYGKLTVIGSAPKTHAYSNKFLFQCECGKIITEQPTRVLTGHLKSCGNCIHSKASPKKKHNPANYDYHTLNPLYSLWRGMISRCENPAYKHYSDYGGRGIKVCDEWHDFNAFLQWSESVGGKPKGFSLDRIDNDGDYEPSNCRWASYHTQSRNKRSNLYLTYNGKTQTLTDWANELHINNETLRNRIRRGWSVEKALLQSTSVHKHHFVTDYLACYTKDGVLVAKYYSLDEIPKEFNYKLIYGCATNHSKYAYDLIWRYEDL